jgi:hypothetical protein
MMAKFDCFKEPFRDAVVAKLILSARLTADREEHDLFFRFSPPRQIVRKTSPADRIQVSTYLRRRDEPSRPTEVVALGHGLKLSDRYRRSQSCL